MTRLLDQKSSALTALTAVPASAAFRHLSTCVTVVSASNASTDAALFSRAFIFQVKTESDSWREMTLCPSVGACTPEAGKHPHTPA